MNKDEREAMYKILEACKVVANDALNYIELEEMVNNLLIDLIKKRDNLRNEGKRILKLYLKALQINDD